MTESPHRNICFIWLLSRYSDDCKLEAWQHPDYLGSSIVALGCAEVTLLA